MISKTTISSAIFAAALGARIQVQDSGFVSDTPDTVIERRNNPMNMSPFTYNVLLQFEKHLESAWDISESAGALLDSRVSEGERCYTGPVWLRTGKGYWETKFFGTSGYGYWDRSVNALYEGEVDCDTWGDSRPTPLGFGRLMLQDTVKNTALNSYVGYFDGSIQPSIYQYDRVSFRHHYDRPDNLMMMEKKVDDG